MSDYESTELDELPLFSISKNGSSFTKPEVNSDTASEKRKQILSALRSGTVTTFEIEHHWHRGQAVIGELRERGFKIEQIGGVYRLISEPTSQRIKVSKAIQDLYYKTIHWDKCRKSRRQFDSNACQQCKQSSCELHVHHWCYNLFNECIETDLITLCVACHKRIHDCASGSQHIHFPNRLEQHMIDRIEREGEKNGTN